MTNRQQYLDFLKKNKPKAPKKTATPKQRHIGLAGKRICFTGALDLWTRPEAQRRASQAGAIISKGMTKNCDFAVCPNQDSPRYDETTLKMRKAKKYGVKFLYEKEFMEIIENCEKNGPALQAAIERANKLSW